MASSSVSALPHSVFLFSEHESPYCHQASGMAYLGECLPSRHEAPGSISSIAYMAVILAHGRERQENEEFRVTFRYTAGSRSA